MVELQEVERDDGELQEVESADGELQEVERAYGVATGDEAG